MGKKKSKERKGKKARKKTVRVKKSEFYEEKDGKLERKKQFCPKCGPGINLAEHKDRFVCGNCSYTKFKK